MKYFIYTLLLLSICLAAFNFTQINYSDLLSSENMVAFIALVAALCVLILSLILLISKKIEKISLKNQ